MMLTENGPTIANIRAASVVPISQMKGDMVYTSACDRAGGRQPSNDGIRSSIQTKT
jgi:hypothetical protein